MTQEAAAAWLSLATAITVTAERLDALAALTRAQSNAAQATADFLIARTKLSRAIGQVSH